MNVITNYSQKKEFRVGESSDFVVAYVYKDEGVATLKDQNGFDVRKQGVTPSRLQDITNAENAAVAWVQTELSPAPPTP